MDESSSIPRGEIDFDNLLSVDPESSTVRLDHLINAYKATPVFIEYEDQTSSIQSGDANLRTGLRFPEAPNNLRRRFLGVVMRLNDPKCLLVITNDNPPTIHQSKIFASDRDSNHLPARVIFRTFGSGHTRYSNVTIISNALHVELQMINSYTPSITLPEEIQPLLSQAQEVGDRLFQEYQRKAQIGSKMIENFITGNPDEH